MMLQLDPPLPLTVVGGAGWKGPTGKGLCHFVIDHGLEHHLIWVIILDETGQIWAVENPYVRGDKNITLGRVNPDPIKA